MTENGLISMSQLKQGDRVLGMEDGKEVYAEVQFWYHHDHDLVLDYLRLSVGESYF